MVTYDAEVNESVVFYRKFWLILILQNFLYWRKYVIRFFFNKFARYPEDNIEVLKYTYSESNHISMFRHPMKQKKTDLSLLINNFENLKNVVRFSILEGNSNRLGLFRPTTEIPRSSKWTLECTEIHSQVCTPSVFPLQMLSKHCKSFSDSLKLFSFLVILMDLATFFIVFIFLHGVPLCYSEFVHLQSIKLMYPGTL